MVSEQKPNGFDFDLCKRNAWLEKQGLQTLKPWSTGTTICGVVYKVRVFFLWSVRGKAIEKGGQRHEVGDGDGDD